MQPDRPCYIRRAADEDLLNAIAAEQFVCVLAARASGKSSLMGRAIRRLRADGQVAAVVDLAQIGTRAESVDSARWHYSIAYRICRELRLKVDLQTWWQDRALLLNEQRLVEFFWDIVLANTDDSVTIFFDEAERVIDRPFSGELFAALHSAYQRRVSEPEFTRLNFVVLGAASPEQFCPDLDASPFAAGTAIRLNDFTLEECLRLAPGFGNADAVVHGLIERIHGWTQGQPYLTQKLARGVVRKGGRLADLDPALNELFLAPGITHEESYLGHMRSMLTDGTARARQATAILTRLARGREVIFDPDSPPQMLLNLGGFVSSDDNGMLRFRSRIIEHVFGPDRLKNSSPRYWQRPAMIGAAAASGILLVGYWYSQVLPRPYIDTLNLVTNDYSLATQAHQRLHRLPGFRRRADSLLADVMIRRSDEATTLVEAEAADAVLRTLPDGAAVADRLLARFWHRRSEAAARRGDRDGALVHALAAIEAGSAAAWATATNLIDGDYALLDRTLHFDSPLVDFRVDWDRNQIVAIDATQRIHRLPVSAGEGDGRPASMRLTALQHIGVTRRFFVDEPGRAGALQLRLTIDHQRPGDLLVRLRAPSGAAAELAVPRRDGGLEQFVFTGSEENGLLTLADESVIGQWELTLFDRLRGESGSLVGWGLSFPGVPQFWDDNPIEGIPLPDPELTEQVTVALGNDGRRAVATPFRADARGAASVWDLDTGGLIADLPLTSRANFLRFLADDRLLVVGPASAELWLIGNAEPVMRVVTAAGFAAPPVVSPDGRFFAVAEPFQDRVRVSLFRSDDGRNMARFVTDPWQDWGLAPEARFLVTFDGSRRGSLVNPLTGETLAGFFHDRALVRVLATAESVVAVDDIGEIVAWTVESGRRTLTPGDAVHVGRVADSSTVGLSDDGSLASYIDSGGLVGVSRVSDGYRLAVFDHGQATAVGARIDPAGARLVTADANRIRSWRLPPGEPGDHDFGDVTAVALESGGQFAMLGYRSGQIRLIRNLPESLERGEEFALEYFGHLGAITSLAINASGDLAASGDIDGVVRIWDTTTGTRSRYLMRHPAGPINSLAFGPNDRWIATAGPRSVRLFELDTGTLASELEVDGSALALAFSPAGDIVAAGDSSGSIYLAAADGAPGVQTIRSRSPVNALRFAETPDLLASGSSDGNLVLWNTLEARAVEGAHRFPGPIGWIDFAPGDGQVQIQSGSWIYRLDRADTGAVVAAATLLPARLRTEPALARTASGVVRVLATSGDGRLVLEDLALTPFSAADGGDPSTPLLLPPFDAGDSLVETRDWQRVLGLEVDSTGSVVRTVDPQNR